MSESLEISLTQTEDKAGLRRTLRLHQTGTSGDGDLTFFFDLLGNTDAPIPKVLDGFVLGVIFLAMQQGRTVKVHGKMSRSAIFNLAEFQSAWACWRPERYRRVDILPDEIIDLPVTQHPPRAISAFSGGVDGTFTAIRHARKLMGNASYPLTDVMLVHGFDVPLGKLGAFDLLLERIRPLVAELGLGIKPVRTNLREASGQEWEDSFGAQLAACLHNYSHDYNYALMGSGEPYSNILYPWGSTPATDHLMSSDPMRIVLDGAAYSRTEKLAEIVKLPTAQRTLKVCWEGADPERNCGQCEKCLRTKLNFLAVGISEPACFDDGLDLSQIAHIPLRNKAQLSELKSILQYAWAHDVSGDWVGKLKQRIDAHGRQPDLMARVARKLGFRPVPKKP